MQSDRGPAMADKPNPHHTVGFKKSDRHLDPTQPWRPGMTPEDSQEGALVASQGTHDIKPLDQPLAHKPPAQGQDDKSPKHEDQKSPKHEEQEQRSPICNDNLGEVIEIDAKYWDQKSLKHEGQEQRSPISNDNLGVDFDIDATKYCKVCQIWLNGQGQLEDHLMGRWHKSNLRLAGES